MKTDKPPRKDTRERRERRPYAPPRLSEYGPLSKLTRGGSLGGGDGVSGRRPRA
jgi:hypothetical protein